MLQPTTSPTSSHSLSHPHAIQLQEALGYDKLFSLKRSLKQLGVPEGEREQTYYPTLLGWLDSGLADGTMISAEDVAGAAEELAVRWNRRGPVLSALFSFIKTRALRRHEREEQQKEVALTAQRRQEEGEQQRAMTRLAISAQRQSFPAEYFEWKERAKRLADELRSLGRSPRELPENPAEWPETYLPAGDA